MDITNSRDMGQSLVYNPYAVNDASMLIGYAEASRIVKQLVNYLTTGKKIVGSRTIANQLAKLYFKDGVIVTEDDVDEAYAIGAGGGCDYEWPYE
jgi:hypothetical protein